MPDLQNIDCVLVAGRTIIIIIIIIYIDSAAVDLTSVGLAQARPNNNVVEPTADAGLLDGSGLPFS